MYTGTGKKIYRFFKFRRTTICRLIYFGNSSEFFYSNSKNRNILLNCICYCAFTKIDFVPWKDKNKLQLLLSSYFVNWRVPLMLRIFSRSPVKADFRMRLYCHLPLYYNLLKLFKVTEVRRNILNYIIYNG